jgi:hypothetical protein
MLIFVGHLIPCILFAAQPTHHPVHHAPAELLNRIATSNPASLDHKAPAKKPFTTGLRVSPVDLGGDPTGRKDSWDALNAALNVCLNQSKLSPNGNFPGDTSFGNGKAIRDMGGCEIDLEGGEYRISKPLVLPEYNANMQFGHGSLVAGPEWKNSSDFLFVIGIQGSCTVPQGSCNIDINFPELFLDGAHKASGMQINNVMGVTIGPGGYFLNFTEYGLQINKGHEVMMERVWMGETNFDFDHQLYNAPPNATAIQINGNDHYILNTIIFSSRIGLEINGAADYVQGVHVWFPLNHAVAFADTMAFHITRGGNRLQGCYIDGGRAVFEGVASPGIRGGALSRNIWSNGFECCQRGDPAPGTSASGILLIGDKVGPGLEIVNNQFGGGLVRHISSRLPLKTARADANCTARLNVSAANRDCQGLDHISGKETEDACAAECCADINCSVYQFCAPGGKCDGVKPSVTSAQCFTGSVDGCTSATRKGWIGMSDGGAGPGPGPAPPGPTPAPGALDIEGVIIAHNGFSKVVASTQITRSLTQQNATKWNFDFCAELIFPVIAIVRVHVVADEGFPKAIARTPVGCKVTVETDVPVTGTVTLDVDSSKPSTRFA